MSKDYLQTIIYLGFMLITIGLISGVCLFLIMVVVILDPIEYNEDGVRGLIDDLMLSYKIEEVDD